MPTRAEKRQAARAVQGMQDVPKVGGHPIVVAVTVNGPAQDKEGNRPYNAYVCAPQTGHTNGEVIALLAMLACTPVFGEAQASNGKLSLQSAIDQCCGLFKQALEGHVHRMVATGAGMKNLTTVQLETVKPGSSN